MRRLVLPTLLLTTAPPTTTTTTYIDPPDATSYPPGYHNEGLQRAANALKPVVEGEFAKIRPCRSPWRKRRFILPAK